MKSNLLQQVQQLITNGTKPLCRLIKSPHDETIDMGFVFRITSLVEEEQDCYQVWFEIDQELKQQCLPHCKSDWFDDRSIPRLNWFEANNKLIRNKDGVYVDNLFVMDSDEEGDVCFEIINENPIFNSYWNEIENRETPYVKWLEDQVFSLKQQRDDQIHQSDKKVD